MPRYVDAFNRPPGIDLNASWIESRYAVDNPPAALLGDGTVMLITSIDNSEVHGGLFLWDRPVRNNQYSRLVYSRVSPGLPGDSGPVVRGSGTYSSMTGYFLSQAGGPDISLKKVVNGFAFPGVTIGDVQLSGPLNEGDVLELRAVDDVLTVLVNNVVVLTVVDADIPTGHVGMVCLGFVWVENEVPAPYDGPVMQVWHRWEGGDIVRRVSTNIGEAKLFRIMGMELKEDFRWRIHASEYHPDIYDLD
jgi:hypothetical protein